MSNGMPLWISGCLNVCLSAGLIVCMSEKFDVWIIFCLFLLISGCLDVYLEVRLFQVFMSYLMYIFLHICLKICFDVGLSVS